MNRVLLWLKQNFGHINLITSLFFCMLSVILKNKIICLLLFCSLIQQILLFVTIVFKVFAQKQTKNYLLDFAQVCTTMFFTIYSIVTVYFGHSYNNKLFQVLTATLCSFLALGSFFNEKSNKIHEKTSEDFFVDGDNVSDDSIK